MTVAISGGFDPVTAGHINLIEEAVKISEKNMCSRCGIYEPDLIIFLNQDDWLMKKKNFIFMPYEDRARILWAIHGVKMVIPVMDKDETVCETLRKFLKPGDIFANGGDRTSENTPEMKVCLDNKITMMFGIGGGKTHSSSALVKKVLENA